MRHRYGLNVQSDVRTLRMVLYREMKNAHALNPHESLDRLCNITLTRARDAYLKKSHDGRSAPAPASTSAAVPVQSSTARVELLERERQVFGNRQTPPIADVDRPLMVNAPRNKPSPDGQLTQTDAQMQRMLAEREEFDNPRPPAAALAPPDQEVHRNKLTQQDFADAMARLSREYESPAHGPPPQPPGGSGSDGGNAGRERKSTPIDHLRPDSLPVITGGHTESNDGEGDEADRFFSEQTLRQVRAAQAEAEAEALAEAGMVRMPAGIDVDSNRDIRAKLFGSADDASMISRRMLDPQARMPTQQQLLENPHLAASIGTSSAVAKEKQSNRSRLRGNGNPVGGGEEEGGDGIGGAAGAPLPFMSSTSAPVGPPLTDGESSRPRAGPWRDEVARAAEEAGMGNEVAAFGGGSKQPPRIEALKYLCVNGFDRDWTLEPYRYTFTARITEGGTRFNDVTAIQATSLIIPAEIKHHLRVSQVSPDYVPEKPTFEHSFSFSYPYVTLMIDELDNVYEGTNDVVRRAFCQFKYQRHYQAPNGRGYIQLDPMQHEVKRFFPNPLSSLRNLSLSIRKPNGTLFNSSRDDKKLKKIEYEPYQAQLLHVVLENTFDRNELYVSDTVLLNVTLVPDDAKGGTEDSFTDQKEVDALRRMQDFLNRSEGHEIIELGQSDESDRNQGFFVYAPGTLDQELGKLELDEQALSALIAYNRGVDDNGGNRSKLLGRLMNFSLQCVICFKVWMSQMDPTVMFSNNKLSEGSGTFPSMFAETA